MARMEGEVKEFYGIDHDHIREHPNAVSLLLEERERLRRSLDRIAHEMPDNAPAMRAVARGALRGEW